MVATVEKMRQVLKDRSDWIDPERKGRLSIDLASDDRDRAFINLCTTLLDWCEALPDIPPQAELYRRRVEIALKEAKWLK